MGGNFWGAPDGTGFSQTCEDGEGDAICDLPYMLDSNNIDHLPLAYMPDITDMEATLSAMPAIPAETTGYPTSTDSDHSHDHESTTTPAETTEAPTAEKATGFEGVLTVITLSATAYIFWRKLS